MTQVDAKSSLVGGEAKLKNSDEVIGFALVVASKAKSYLSETEPSQLDRAVQCAEIAEGLSRTAVCLSKFEGHSNDVEDWDGLDQLEATGPNGEVEQAAQVLNEQGEGDKYQEGA